MPIPAPTVLAPTHPRVAALDRLGDEIAELSAHLDAATARLLTLIRAAGARPGRAIARRAMVFAPAPPHRALLRPDGPLGRRLPTTAAA